MRQWERVERAAWPTLAAAPDSVTVVSFNTLRRGYRFNGNTYTQEAHRDYAHRKQLHRQLFCDELGKTADLLLLQEIENPEDDFDFLAPHFSYVRATEGGGKKSKKEGQHSFTIPFLFFRTERFEQVWVNQRSRAVLAQLRDRESGRSLLVASVHLQGGPTGDKDRSNQLSNVRKFLAARMETLSEEERASVGIIVGGAKDFNFEVAADEFAELSLERVFSREDVPFTHKWGQRDPQFLSSLDQMFASGATLRKTRFRSAFSEEDWAEYLSWKGMPNERHQSDHVPLVATFEWPRRHKE